MNINRHAFARLVENAERPAPTIAAPFQPSIGTSPASVELRVTPTWAEPRGVRSQAEVAALMTERGYPMSRARVFQIEGVALRKLRQDPVLKQLAADLGIA
ncbi:MAG TPA: hypothetical protein VG125_22030 [Pirellulales bacterium]|jgi:hypothetical protein|nr:hypothetical protein [Pirellulales bacterium]